ncbi:MAG: hypothetical protein IMW97_06890 [Firmicutes bacterium]|nr:hypothetical protein [Candidatus Fermentithermobacillaceae bacterium]
MSSQLKGLSLGILAGLGVAGLVLPWYVEVRGSFGPAPAWASGSLTGFGWSVLVGLKPPFFPFPIWLSFPSERAGLGRRVSADGTRERPEQGSPRHGTHAEKPAIRLEDVRRHAREVIPWLKYLGHRFEVLDLKLRLELGLGDAAATALAAGGLLALVRTVLPVITRGGRRRLCRGIKIVPVYDRTTLSGHFMVKGRIRIFYLLTAAAKMVVLLSRIRRLSAAGWAPEYPSSSGAR